MKRSKYKAHKKRTTNQTSTADGENRYGPKHQNRRCPECGSDSVKRHSNHDLICENCAAVIEEGEIDQGPDWRSFESDQEDKSRVGPPLTLTQHDHGLSSQIDWKDRDGYGNQITGNRARRLARMRMRNKRAKTAGKKERNLRTGLSEVKRVCSALGAPDPVHNLGAELFRKAHKDDLAIGRSLEGLASASVYAAARVDNHPITLDEVAAVSQVDRKFVWSDYQKLLNSLDLVVGIQDPRNYVPRFCSALGLPDTVEQRAISAIQAFKKRPDFAGDAPTSVAAQAIYAAAQYEEIDLTQKKLSNEIDVSPPTIRKRYDEFSQILEGQQQ